MSGKEWNKNAKGETHGQEGRDREEHRDDDFGDFEGFLDIDEIEPSVAQPLPQSLQANWGNFPDNVPSQRTMTSSLQPDLLPNLAEMQAEGFDSNRGSQELARPLAGANVTGGDEPAAACALPDVSPSSLDLAQSPDLQLSLQPGPDVQRSANGSNMLQSQLPDVSPQSNSNCLGASPAVSPVVSSSLGFLLPDVSPVGCIHRGFHLSDLPDVSEVRSVSSALDNRDHDAASLENAFVLLTESTAAGDSSAEGLHYQPEAGGHIFHNVEARRSSLELSRPEVYAACSQPDVNGSMAEIQERLERLQHQNIQLLMEMTEMRARNVEMHRMLTDCIAAVQRQKTPEKAAQPLDSDEAVLSSRLEEALSIFYDKMESKTEDQEALLGQLKASLVQQEECKQMLSSHAESMALATEKHLCSFKEQLMSDIQSAMQELSKNSACHCGERLLSLETAVEKVVAFSEQQMKQHEEHSSKLTVTLLDSLLLGARRQLQELVQPDNGPAS